MYDSQYHIKPVMVARRRLTDQERHLAVARIRTGSTQCDVAGELGVSQNVISRLVHRFRDTGSVGERPRSGAPRGTTRNDDQYLRTYALRNRDLTAPVLQSRLSEVRGTRMSRQTIRRRPLQVTPLTDRHRRLRLQWARDHVTSLYRTRYVGKCSSVGHDVRFERVVMVRGVYFYDIDVGWQDCS